MNHAPMKPMPDTLNARNGSIITMNLKASLSEPSPYAFAAERLKTAKALVAARGLTWTGLTIDQRHKMLDIAGLAIGYATALLDPKCEHL